MPIFPWLLGFHCQVMGVSVEVIQAMEEKRDPSQMPQAWGFFEWAMESPVWRETALKDTFSRSSRELTLKNLWECWQCGACPLWCWKEPYKFKNLTNSNMTWGTYFPRSWINGANRSRWSPLIWVSPASWTRQLGLNNELKEGDRWVEFLGIWGGHYATRDGGFYGDSLVQEAEGSSQGWLDTHCCGLIVGFWSLVVGGRVKDESHDVKLPFKVKAKVVVIRIMTLQADLAFYSVDVTVCSWWPASFLGLLFIFFDLSELPSRTIYIYNI